VHLGLALPTFGPDADADGIAGVSRTTEEMGYDSLWTGDRVLAPETPGARVVSRGHLTVGLGLGWKPDEYTAVSVPWEGRGARRDETPPRCAWRFASISG
jgi:alkanesulfonate monooxygenase SsuD/methylene tetrahydromethanopterin reductase-like flavin-dependent oxidoreductase (luciferase family)